MRNRVFLFISGLAVVGLLVMIAPWGANSPPETKSPSAPQDGGGSAAKESVVGATPSTKDKPQMMTHVTEILMENVSLPNSLASGFQEGRHQIEQWGGPGESVELSHHFDAENADQVVTMRGVVSTTKPSGNDVTLQTVTKRQLVEVDPEKSIGKYAIKTAKIFGEGEHLINRAPVEVESSLSIDSKGRLIESRQTSTILGASLVVSEISNNILRFPDGPLNLGDRYTYTAVVPEDAPGPIKESPPVLKGVVKGLVRFDGVEAVLLEAEDTAYSLAEVDSKRVRRTVVTKLQRSARFYVQLESGAILWSQVNTKVVQSDEPNVVGVETVEINELERKM